MRYLLRYVASAPLTFSWLLVLLVTTVIQHSLTHHQLQEVLLDGSTNLHHLAIDPIRVLFSSLLWIDGYFWWPYLIVFCLFLAPAERWLGPLRWLAVGLTAHIIATYVSQGVLYLAIEQAVVSHRLVNAPDIGVSYFAVGIAGVLTYHVVLPWRWVYFGLLVLLFGVTAGADPTFTQWGHLCALLVGLACYPLTRRRSGRSWDPVRKLRTCGSDRRRCRTPGSVRGTSAGSPGERG
jgi:hypothetical protein